MRPLLSQYKKLNSEDCPSAESSSSDWSAGPSGSMRGSDFEYSDRASSTALSALLSSRVRSAFSQPFGLMDSSTSRCAENASWISLSWSTRFCASKCSRSSTTKALCKLFRSSRPCLAATVPAGGLTPQARAFAFRFDPAGASVPQELFLRLLDLHVQLLGGEVVGFGKIEKWLVGFHSENGSE